MSNLHYTEKGRDGTVLHLPASIYSKNTKTTNFNYQKNMNKINNFNCLNQECLTIMPNFRVHNATLSSEFIIPNKEFLTSSDK